MESEVSAIVAKGGETPIQIGFWRSNFGITCHVKLLPRVEGFMRGMGNGEEMPVNPNLGRYWITGDASKPLRVYNLEASPGLLVTENGVAYRIDKPGWPIEDIGGNGSNTAFIDPSEDMPPSGNARAVGRSLYNLSMLRLVGASEGDGVTFSLKGCVYSVPELREVANKVQDAAHRFYINYLKPYRVTVFVSTQEMSG